MLDLNGVRPCGGEDLAELAMSSSKILYTMRLTALPTPLCFILAGKPRSTQASLSFIMLQTQLDDGPLVGGRSRVRMTKTRVLQEKLCSGPITREMCDVAEVGATGPKACCSRTITRRNKEKFEMLTGSTSSLHVLSILSKNLLFFYTKRIPRTAFPPGSRTH